VKIFQHASSLTIPRTLDEVFTFFADAHNLELITPPWLRFEVVTSRPIEMRVGAIIDYRLRVRGIPVRWRSEIAAWEPPHRFVDRQLRGPYRLWIHEHRFVERDGTTETTDHVRYAVWGGTLVDRLVVRRDVTRIFGYREHRLAQLFESDS
jgi:ligand-binding SRPBCC domain-containing protein